MFEFLLVRLFTGTAAMILFSYFEHVYECGIAVSVILTMTNFSKGRNIVSILLLTAQFFLRICGYRYHSYIIFLLGICSFILFHRHTDETRIHHWRPYEREIRSFLLKIEPSVLHLVDRMLDENKYKEKELFEYLQMLHGNIDVINNCDDDDKNNLVNTRNGNKNVIIDVNMNGDRDGKIPCRALSIKDYFNTKYNWNYSIVQAESICGAVDKKIPSEHTVENSTNYSEGKSNQGQGQGRGRHFGPTDAVENSEENKQEDSVRLGDYLTVSRESNVDDIIVENKMKRTIRDFLKERALPLNAFADRILQDYHGREEELLTVLNNEYGPSSSPSSRPDASSGSGLGSRSVPASSPFREEKEYRWTNYDVLNNYRKSKNRSNDDGDSSLRNKYRNKKDIFEQNYRQSMCDNNNNNDNYDDNYNYDNYDDDDYKEHSPWSENGNRLHLCVSSLSLN